MKSIQSAWDIAKKVFCLGNKWRDSIYYSVGTAYVFHQALDGDIRQLAAIPLGITLREFLRYEAWQASTSNFHCVGTNWFSVDPVKNSKTALFVAATPLFILGATLTILGMLHRDASTTRVGSVFTASSLVFAYRAATHDKFKLPDVGFLYLNKETGMWNWPKKNEDGKKSQSQGKPDSSYEELTSHQLSPVPIKKRPTLFRRCFQLTAKP